VQHEPAGELSRQRGDGSFFQLLKRERIKQRIYSAHADARGDVFDYIELFYNPNRRYGSNNGLSPIAFEKRYALNG
jgi:putative transposase